MIQLANQFFTTFAAACRLPESVYGIPTWYKYLPGETDPLNSSVCRVVMDFSFGALTSLLAIGLAVIEILLFIAGIIAVAFIVYGGFRYVLSQGSPENTKIAKDSVLNAVIGLVITIIATTVVRFIGNRLGS